MKRLLTYSIILILTVMLSSCSLFSPVKMPSPNTYMLTEIPSTVVKKHARPITLLVMQPESEAIYNTVEMAYSIKPYQIAYFGKNRWAETPSQMLQPLLVQTLQNTHHFHAVVTPAATGRFDYTLHTQILELVQDFTRHPTVVRVTVRVQILQADGSKVVATRLFSVDEPVQYKTPYSGVFAANRATEKLLDQIARFTVRYTK